METDKLRIIGESRLGKDGANGTAKPAGKIENPFDDDDQGPKTIAKPTKVATKTADTDNNNDTRSDAEKVDEPTVLPAKAGRSRLILQPKKKDK